jgi:hypothetical protein
MFVWGGNLNPPFGDHVVLWYGRYCQTLACSLSALGQFWILKLKNLFLHVFFFLNISYSFIYRFGRLIIFICWFIFCICNVIWIVFFSFFLLNKNKK